MERLGSLLMKVQKQISFGVLGLDEGVLNLHVETSSTYMLLPVLQPNVPHDLGAGIAPNPMGWQWMASLSRPEREWNGVVPTPIVPAAAFAVIASDSLEGSWVR